MEIINNNSRKLIPTAGEAYGAAWQIMGKYFLVLLAVSILYGIISGPTAMVNRNISDFQWSLIPMVLFGIGFGVFIAAPIGYSTDWVFLKAVRGEPIDVRDMFAVFQKNYWNAVAGNLVVGLIIGLGFVLLIVPGIILACRLAFVRYLIIDREMDFSDAISKSWEMTKGYGVQIFVMGLLAFVTAILGLIALIVGIVVSIVWIKTAFAVMYQAVIETEGHFRQPVE